ncbi:hypothetical protein [Marinobacter sp.]|uniref:hypothetical protein n=1 Tax=Marinobacter sp. TaxID=50741 RepID=UPI003569FEA3
MPSPRMRRARELVQERQLRTDLKEQLVSNRPDIHVLNARELTGVWVNIQKSKNVSEEDIAATFRELTEFSLDMVRDHTGTVSSAIVLSKLGADMHRSGSIFGTYKVIQKEGKHFIVLSGYAGLRKHLNAPVYGLSNPKVVRMGVGISAANAALKSGAALTLVLSPTIRTLEWLFVDQKKTLESVLAHIATDIVKGFVAAGAAYFIGGMLPAVASMAGFAITAVIPVGVGIAVAIAAGFALNELDERYQITEKLTEALVDCRKDWVIATEKVSRDLHYYFDTPQGNLEFIRRFMGAGGGYGY